MNQSHIKKLFSIQAHLDKMQAGKKQWSVNQCGN